MKVSISEIRSAVRDVLTEAATVEQLPQKYKFLGRDTAKTFQDLVRSLARDVANAKGNFNDETVKDAAADIGMSMGAHADELIGHLVGQQQQQKPKTPPPPSRANTQPNAPQAFRKPAA